MTVYEGGVFIFKVGADAHYLGVAKIEIEKTQTQRGPQVRVWPREWRVVSTAGVAPDPDHRGDRQAIRGQARREPQGGGRHDGGGARFPARHGAAQGERDRQPHRRRHPRVDEGGRGDHQRRRHPRRPYLCRRHHPDPQGHPHRAAVRQRRGDHGHHRRRPADRAGGGGQPGRGRGGPVPARVGHDLRLRRAAAARAAGCSR